MGLRRTRSNLIHYVNRADAFLDVTGPVCDLCNAIVDSETLVEGYPGECHPLTGETLRQADSTTCKVLVRHHGAEELHVFDFESTNWTHEDLRRRMQHRRWFCPVDVGAETGASAVQVPSQVSR